MLDDDQTPGFGQGRTMRANPSITSLRFVRQKVPKSGGKTAVITTLRHHYHRLHPLTLHEIAPARRQ